ncbi:unnamed protein product [Menidia menidia]|uniref:(Atlantic silverside) hypothetical protein n=1 Tax=Menidia menidia TaxID=238744 RepID=A0A8S4ADW4_9TELE|nr:unnamed protein product [Menidia menidia]
MKNVVPGLKMTEVKSAALIIICVTLLLHGCVAALNCSSPTPESLFEELEKNLFSKKNIRPVKNFSDSVDVNISITVQAVLGVDDKAQTLSAVLWVVLIWHIEGLSWDEKECGASHVTVPREKLWLPDINIAESVGKVELPPTPFVILHNSGRVYDDKPMAVVTSCNLQIYTFPFDVQICSLTFGSYLHFDTDIRMIQHSTASDILSESINVSKRNGEWELKHISVEEHTLELDVGNYSEMKYFIYLHRRPKLYVVNLVIPSCFLVTLDLFSFLLPPASVDRSAFKMTLILGYTVFLLLMNELLPVTGDATPLINVFFSISLALMVASLLETVFITNIGHSSSQYDAVPTWLSILVLRYLAVLVGLPPKKKSDRVTVILNPNFKETASTNGSIHISGSPSQSISADTPPAEAPLEPAMKELLRLGRDLAAIRLQIDRYFQESKTSQDWQMVGVVIDRLLFGLYIVFITTSFITVICIWVLNNKAVV